jgi:hypothetical protein
MIHNDSSHRGSAHSATRHVGVLPLKADPSFAYTLTWAVAGLLLTSSVAGLLYGPRGLYDPDATTYPALLGQDAVALIFGLPLLLVSARRARRGSVRALLSWMGALFYVAYFWYFYVVGIRFSPFLVVHIALVSTSMYAVLYLVSALNMAELKARFDPSTPIRLIGGFLMTVSVAFALLWLAVIASATLKGADMGAVTRRHRWRGPSATVVFRGPVAVAGSASGLRAGRSAAGESRHHVSDADGHFGSRDALGPGRGPTADSHVRDRTAVRARVDGLLPAWRERSAVRVHDLVTAPITRAAAS